jgi:hypothetical protein
MKRFIFAALAALIGTATPASAITLADLDCAAYSLPLPRFARYVAANCPSNVWYVCRSGAAICCDNGTKTTEITLK